MGQCMCCSVQQQEPIANYLEKIGFCMPICSKGLQSLQSINWVIRSHSPCLSTSWSLNCQLVSTKCNLSESIENMHQLSVTLLTSLHNIYTKNLKEGLRLRTQHCNISYCVEVLPIITGRYIGRLQGLKDLCDLFLHILISWNDPYWYVPTQTILNSNTMKVSTNTDM